VTPATGHGAKSVAGTLEQKDGHRGEALLGAAPLRSVASSGRRRTARRAQIRATRHAEGACRQRLSVPHGLALAGILDGC
jgi:hypothetical protein